MSKKTKTDFAGDLKESAQNIWLAGLGAVSVAEEEGSKFFKNLVKKGEKFESRRRKQVEEVVDRVKDGVKDGVDDVRDGVESKWNRFGDAFDRKVRTAVDRLGVPTREEIHKLTERVEDLTAKLDSMQAKRSTRRRTPAKKTARKTA